MTNTSFNLANGIFLPFSPEATGVGIPGQLAVWSTDNKIGPAGSSVQIDTDGHLIVGTVPSFGQINFPFNGTNYLSANGGSSSLLQIQVDDVATQNICSLFSNQLTRLFVGPISPFATGWVGSYISVQPFMYCADQYGTGATFSALRTSDWTSTYPANGSPNITQVFTDSILMVHDRTTSGPTAMWGSYWQTERTAAATAAPMMFMLEASFHNLGASVTGDPFTLNPSGFTGILRLDSGVGATSGNAVTNAIDIIANGAQLNAGIRFGSGALTTVGGLNQAIQLPENYALVWYHAASSVSAIEYVDTSGFFQYNSNGYNLKVAGSLVSQILSTGLSITGAISASTTIRPGTFTVATLPAAGTAGRYAYVTDGGAALAWGATVTGSGTAKYLVWDNGTNWTVSGK